MNNYGKPVCNQSGTALFISLVILVIMTILGLSSMSNTVLETKMATNAQQRQIAYQAAEKALREAESWLRDNINSDIDVGSKFIYDSANFTSADDSTTSSTSTTDSSSTKDTTAKAAKAYYNSVKYGSPVLSNASDWTDTNSIVADGVAGEDGKNAIGALTNVANNHPRYIIEYVGKVQRPPAEIGSGAPPDTRFHAFKITALGYGADPSATYMLSSTVFICPDGRCG
jgi:type IV pilus assembly protein PilX